MNNNFVVAVPRDLKKIQSKLFFGLTKRQLIGFNIALTIGIIVFLALKRISLDLAMYGLFFVSAPIIFATIYQKDGLYTEKWIKLILEHKYINPTKRYYKVSKRNYLLAKERNVMERATKQSKTKNNKPTKHVTTSQSIPNSATTGR